MKKSPIIIDIIVTIIDNYGDMGFAYELISAITREYVQQYECIIWTDDVMMMTDFVSRSWIDHITIGDISNFWLMRKSAIGISILHAPIPDLHLFAPHALILRIDYLSLDPIWICHNSSEHTLSTSDRQIIELIPSPLEWWAGLLPSVHTPKQENSHKHITIFAYPSTLDRMDWDSFPSDMTIYVFGILESKKENIICLDFLPMLDFYRLLDTSEFVIIRWEVSFSHMIQGSVPFFWDIYRDIGGWPSDQSAQFLEFVWASPEYREIHQILGGQKEWKIYYSSMLEALSHTQFNVSHVSNLIHTVKKHIDRFHNSI